MWSVQKDTTKYRQKGGIRMNVRELKAQMVRKDKTVDQLCTALGISRSAWFRKVGGESEFTQGEIMGLRFELELDDQQTGIIFFDKEMS